MFPFLKKSSWYLVFTDAEEINFLAMERLIIKERVFTKEIKDPMRKAGRLQMHLVLKNDSYKGFDKNIKIAFNVIEEAKNRKTLEYNEEDIKASKEPSLMQQMMELNPGEDSDEDEEDDDASTANGSAGQ